MVRMRDAIFSSDGTTPDPLRTPRNFWVPHIISETGKATNVKFCTHFHAIDRNKNSLTILGKVSRGRSQGLSKIFRASVVRIALSSLR